MKTKNTKTAAAPAGYRMLLKALKAGTNVSETLLVGAYVDVKKLLDNAKVPVTSVKGVYIDKKFGIVAHIYLTGKDGSQKVDDKKYTANVAKALGAKSVTSHAKAPTAEGSKAKNFLVRGITAISADDYTTLTANELSTKGNK